MKVKTKLSLKLTVALIFAVFTTVMVFLASLGGYWLVAIAAILGFITGGQVWKEEMAINTDIPEDWYNDVGTIEKDFGKSTKH